MKRFLQFLMVVYVIFRITDCSNEERKQQRAIESKEARINHAPRKVPIEVSKTPPTTGTLDGDSLESMYDKNYMDYNLYNNPEDDDEWHDYFND